MNLRYLLRLMMSWPAELFELSEQQLSSAALSVVLKSHHLACHRPMLNSIVLGRSPQLPESSASLQCTWKACRYFSKDNHIAQLYMQVRMFRLEQQQPLYRTAHAASSELCSLPSCSNSSNRSSSRAFACPCRCGANFAALAADPGTVIWLVQS